MSALAIVTPIFGLIAVGYLAARAQLLSPTSQKGISEFAFNFAMPALLFRSMATAPEGPAGSARIVFAYFGGVAIIWLLATILTRLALRRPSIDAPTIAMSSVYGNIVMIGIPMVLAAVGPEGAAPMAAILSLQSAVMWFVGLLHQQSVEQSGSRSALTVARDLITELAQNPIVLAILAGTLWRLSGATLPTAFDSSLALLGQAGIPCAQVALGASLTRFAIKGQVPTLSLLLVMKLLVLPAVVYGLAVHVFALPRTAAEVALIFASVPAGANAFLFAERSQRVVNSTSGAVALGTLLGAVTSTLLISQLRWLVGP
jgi:malonate transporter and related proteins